MPLACGLPFGIFGLLWYVFGTPLMWFGAGVGGLVAVSAAGNAYETRRIERERAKRRAGLCLTCGYDLRATPSPIGPLLARCPEMFSVL